MRVSRLIESGPVSNIAVVHVDDVFGVFLTERSNQFDGEFNRLLPSTSLDEVRWYQVCWLPSLSGQDYGFTDQFASINITRKVSLKYTDCYSTLLLCIASPVAR